MSGAGGTCTKEKGRVFRSFADLSVSVLAGR